MAVTVIRRVMFPQSVVCSLASSITRIHNTAFVHNSLRRYWKTNRPQEDILINEEIPFSLVDVCNANLQRVLPIGEAIRLAGDSGKELVLKNAHTDPPECVMLGARDLLELLERRKNDDLDTRQLDEQVDAQHNFDPALKVKGMRISAVAAEQDLARKIQQTRRIIKEGHRVDVVFVRSTASPSEQSKRIERVCDELRDISKPVNLPLSKNNLSALACAVKFWPCRSPSKGSTIVTNDSLPSDDNFNNTQEDAELLRRRSESVVRRRKRALNETKRALKTN